MKSANESSPVAVNRHLEDIEGLRTHLLTRTLICSLTTSKTKKPTTVERSAQPIQSARRIAGTTRKSKSSPSSSVATRTSQEIVETTTELATTTTEAANVTPTATKATTAASQVSTSW